MAPCMLRRHKYLRSSTRQPETEGTLKQSNFIPTTDEQGMNTDTNVITDEERMIKK